MADDLLKVEIGRYTLIQETDGSLQCMVTGSHWNELDNERLLMALAQEVTNLREKIGHARECLACSGIADAYGVCLDALIILEGEDGK